MSYQICKDQRRQEAPYHDHIKHIAPRRGKRGKYMIIVKSQTFTTERELNEYIMNKMTDPVKKDAAFKVHRIIPVVLTSSAGKGEEFSISSTINYVLESEETLDTKKVY